MKQIYVPAELEILQFEAEDVITTSTLEAVDEYGTPII